jgi:hypothetical protein
MKYKTFQEWKDEGFHVIKGEKSKIRNKHGKCLFSKNQVKKDRYFSIDEQIEMLCINEIDLY